MFLQPEERLGAGNKVREKQGRMKTKHQTDERVLARTIEHCRQRKIIVPTFAELRHPETIPARIQERLSKIGPDDLDPANLFRINWKNRPESTGGLFHDGNRIVFPSELTGVAAPIVGLIGRSFPTGAHKVGAGFGCLVPRLVSGGFDPSSQKAVWPSTGNFCRGGVFDCALLSCPAIAILPEQMSRERFDWLQRMGTDEIITTPGGESNVKAIYDKCRELEIERGESIVVFNQFAEFGNAVWHYHTTGTYAEESFRRLAAPGDRCAAWVTATGSAGTLAAGDYLKHRFPGLRTVAAEALQCPTLLHCGFGDHKIEGIGDKHVPWIHNARNTDLVCAVDDAQCVSLMRLFNEPTGTEFLLREGVAESVVKSLPLLGISSICNLIAAIQTAKHYELTDHDWIAIPLTDSMELYQSRVEEQRGMQGPYTIEWAGRHFGRYLEGIGTDNMRELGHRDRKMLHNLKYFTWVEQQGKTVEELQKLWDPDFWAETYALIDEWDKAIGEFNAATGLLTEDAEPGIDG